MFSKLCSAGSTSTRKKCASGARRSSIRSGQSKRGWEQPTSSMKTLPRVATEMALHVLTYNLTRVINIMGPRPLIAAIKA